LAHFSGNFAEAKTNFCDLAFLGRDFRKMIAKYENDNVHFNFIFEQKIFAKQILSH
jgi:hypothetical protein